MSIAMFRFAAAAILAVSLVALPSVARADKTRTTNQLQIAELYVAYFDRLPDAQESNFWISTLETGQTLSEVAQSLSNHSETLVLHPYLALGGIADDVSRDAFITSIYRNLFDREPELDALSFWSGVLANNPMMVGDVVVNIVQGARGADRQTLTTRITADTAVAVKSSTAN